MRWFGRKAKSAQPERRTWCSECKRIYRESEVESVWSHRVWNANIQQGVDFGRWVHHQMLPEAEDAPSKPTADGRLSIVESGALSLVKESNQ